MAYRDTPRLYCFSLGDFRESKKCFFSFLVKHHLEKKYELEEGSENSAIGNLLDLVIKRIHSAKAYSQLLDYLLDNLFSAALNEIKNSVAQRGEHSFYGSTVKFLTPGVIKKAKITFKDYYLTRKGKINTGLPYKDFWECLLPGEQNMKLWGGPDALEMGDDGIPEVIDYKFLEDSSYLDMDLMPKLYILLCSAELTRMGYKKVRFRVRLWKEPLNEDFYEEFDLSVTDNFKDFFRLKIGRILSINEITFCDKPYCQVCSSDKREKWTNLLKTQFNLG